jgi:hypothetical protein
VAMTADKASAAHTVARLLTIALAGAMFSARVRAQSSPISIPVVRGDMVELVTSGSAVVAGRVVSRTAQSLELLAPRTGQRTTIVVDSIRSYRIGLAPPRKQWAKRGALVGGAVMLAAASLSLRDDMTTRSDRIIPTSAFVIPIALTFPVIGAGVGALIAPVRWQPEIRVTAIAVPHRHATSIGLRLFF